MLRTRTNSKRLYRYRKSVRQRKEKKFLFFSESHPIISFFSLLAAKMPVSEITVDQARHMDADAFLLWSRLEIGTLVDEYAFLFRTLTEEAVKRLGGDCIITGVSAEYEEEAVDSRREDEENAGVDEEDVAQFFQLNLSIRLPDEENDFIISIEGVESSTIDFENSIELSLPDVDQTPPSEGEEEEQEVYEDDTIEDDEQYE